MKLHFICTNSFWDIDDCSMVEIFCVCMYITTYIMIYCFSEEIKEKTVPPSFDWQCLQLSTIYGRLYKASAFPCCFSVRYSLLVLFLISLETYLSVLFRISSQVEFIWIKILMEVFQGLHYSAAHGATQQCLFDKILLKQL